MGLGHYHKVFLFDDEITTGITIINAIKQLIEEEVKEIHIAIIFSFLKLNVLKKINSFKQVKSFVTTNLGFPCQLKNEVFDFKYRIAYKTSILREYMSCNQQKKEY